MNIKLKKDEGFVQYAFCIMLFAICTLLILYSLRMRIVQEQKMFIEDGITESALASAIIDLNEYGTYSYVRSGSNNYWDEEEDRILDKFKETLQTNLKLDSNLKPDATNTIITSPVRIVNFWIYNKRVEDYKTEAGNYVLIRDYSGNWVRQHTQIKDEWRILKYCANLDADGRTTGTYTYINEDWNEETRGELRTPKDTNVVTVDAGGSNTGTGDGAGNGDVKVEGMTLYVSIQFEINPFGYNRNETYRNGLFNAGSLVGDTTITKTVVVSVSNDE